MSRKCSLRSDQSLSLGKPFDTKQASLGIINWLLHRDLIRFEELHTLEVQDVSRRNINFRISRLNDLSLFVKIGIDHEHRNCLQHEWDVLDAVNRAARTCKNTPKPVSHDTSNGIYVYEYINEKSSLRRLLHSPNVKWVCVCIAAATEAICELRNISIQRLPVSLSRSIPLPFTFCHRDSPSKSDSSPATIEYLRMIELSAVLLRLIEKCSALWSPDAFSHSDIRLDNLLVVGKSTVFILDFEFACIGDRAWDFSCLIGELLTTPIMSIDTTKTLSEIAFDDRLIKNLAAVFSTLNDKLLSRLNDSNKRMIMSRLPSFAVAHVLQTLYELSLSQSTISRHIVLGLQLCENIAREPETLFQLFV